MREIAARTQGIPRSRGARNALANARAVIEWEAEARRLHEPEADAWRAFWRALALAPDLETFEALIRGESVPIKRLDPAWVGRLGRRTL